MASLDEVARAAQASAAARLAFERTVRTALKDHSVRAVAKAAGFKSPSPIQNIQRKDHAARPNQNRPFDSKPNSAQ